jgi:hypothetical protein
MPNQESGRTQDSSAPPTGAPAAEPQVALPPLPPGWVEQRNEWAGVRVAYPAGWRALCTGGTISVRQDPAGLAAASIQPVHLPMPMPAAQLARQWLESLRPFLPYLNAWEAPESAATDGRCVLRVQTQLYGQDLAGSYLISTHGQDGMISGFLAPRQQADAYVPTFQHILASFRPIPQMARAGHTEPSEGAFQVWAPQGWTAQPGLNRNNIGGSASQICTVRQDPAGLVCAVQPGLFWVFQEPNPLMWGMPSPYQNRPYEPAAKFSQGFLAQWMSQYNQGLRIETIEERPDLALRAGLEGIKAGVDPRTMEITAVHMLTSYNEGGRRMRQVSEVSVTHPRSQGGFFMPTPGGLWMAFLTNYYRAPEEEFAGLEPVLQGVLDSMRVNPAWQQRELGRNQAYMAAQQQDIQRRQRQISQTLSETSDIVSQGYWDRQQVYDDLSHQWSNTILGYQDMTDNAGTVYNVPSGYDQYWKDGLGNVAAGGWLSDPGLGWTRLDPTGQ